MVNPAALFSETFFCPISVKNGTPQIMVDPVVAADGHTYEREAIDQWLQTQNTSPVTGEKLQDATLRSNQDKRNQILGFLNNHPEFYKNGQVYLQRSWINELVVAIKHQNIQRVQECLNKDRRLLTLSLEANSTALRLACEFGSPEVVDILLETFNQRDQLIQPEAIGFRAVHLNVLLERALNRGEFPKCELLVSLGAELEQLDASTKNTLLHRMVIQGNQDAVKWLLERGQKILLEAENMEGNTPLSLSVIRGSKESAELIEFLLRAGVAAQIKYKQQKTPLHIAVENGDIGATRLLLKYGEDPIFGQGDAKLNVLHIAAKRGDAQMLEFLLHTQAALINFGDTNENTPLHLAVENNHDSIIPMLLEAGALHNMINRQFKTPEDVARSEGRPEPVNRIRQTVQKLIDAKQNAHVADMQTDVELRKEIRLLQLLFGAASNNYNNRDGRGRTAVYAAAALGDVAAITAFAARDADVNIPNEKGVTPLCIAAENGYIDAVKALRVAGADVNTPARDGRTPVHAAAEHNHALVIAFLSSQGADVNVKKFDEEIPICAAAREGHKEAVEALITAGADVNMRGAGGRTALYIAAKYGHNEIITLLLVAGADVTMKVKHLNSKTGESGCQTAEQAAIERGCTGIAEQLRNHVAEHPQEAEAAVAFRLHFVEEQKQPFMGAPAFTGYRAHAHSAPNPASNAQVPGRWNPFSNLARRR